LKIKILKKQRISYHCFVCGIENICGMKARFYELENGEMLGYFNPRYEHQSYPGRIHGGISAAILDETIGRAVNITEPDAFGVTVNLELRYRKPVPIGTPLRVIGRIDKNNHRLFEGSGEILLPNGDIAVEAIGKYMKLSPKQIAGDVNPDDEMFFMDRAGDLTEVEL
jgi:acyl-coenzyme A thioesterase PaaI-like protein